MSKRSFLLCMLKIVRKIKQLKEVRGLKSEKERNKGYEVLEFATLENWKITTLAGLSSTECFRASDQWEENLPHNKKFITSYEILTGGMKEIQTICENDGGKLIAL